MTKFLRFLQGISWAILIIFGVYLWIFDWGVDYVVLTIITAGVLTYLSSKNIIKGQGIAWMAIAVLFGVHIWACYELHAHKARHDTGERWSQYGAL